MTLKDDLEKESWTGKEIFAEIATGTDRLEKKKFVPLSALKKICEMWEIEDFFAGALKRAISEIEKEEGNKK